MIPEHIIERHRLWEACLHITIEGMTPPSINKLYKAGYMGSLKLTTEGRAFMNSLRTEIAVRLGRSQYPPWLYNFYAFVGQPEFTNKDFVKDVGIALRRNRPLKLHNLIKTKDADGPLKKVQDVFSQVIGLGDHHFATSVIGKYRGEECLDLLLIPLTLEEVLTETGVSEEVLNLWSPPTNRNW